MLIFDFLKKHKRERIEVEHELNIKEFHDFVFQWNIDNPIDRWYREKYGIKFNSPDHRVINLIDVAFEFKEDTFYNEVLNNEKEEYDPSKGNWLKSEPVEDDLEELSNEELADLLLKDE